MIGITSFGAYVPYLRLPFSAISGGPRGGGGGPGEKSVANYDEDSVTMAVAAGTDCLKGIPRESVTGIYFASTTYPYREKQGASVIAKALDLPRDIATADFGGSLRAGANALRAAIDAVKAGSAKNILVVISDCRMGAPKSALERSFGDGAAAFFISDGAAAATIEANFSVSDEIIDVWRTEGEPFVHSWEDRFVIDHGYTHNVVAAAKGLLKKAGLTPKDVTKAVLYGPDARSHEGVARALGFDPKTQVQDPMFGKVGNAGAAFAPMLLVAALQSAKAGDKLLLTSYGDGADAYLVNVTENIAKLADRRGVKWHLARRAEMASYDKYVRFRNLMAAEYDRRAGGGISATVHFRDRNEDISLHAHKCKKCGTMQFPFQRVCYSCYSKDNFEEVRLSDKKGKLVSFTMDYFGGNPDPPGLATMTETEGGCRLYIQMTDGAASELKLDLPVEFTFRKIHDAGGTPNYFWKVTPVRG